MSLRFIYGKSGTGKTTYCFNEIKELINNNEKVYIITPEQFSFTAEKNLMELCGKKAVINAEVITFKRMSHRIIKEVGGVINQNITNCGKAMLLENIIEKNKKNLNFLGKNDKNLEVVLRMVTELKKNNISSNIIVQKNNEIDDEYIKLKLKDINILYDNFTQIIENKYLDDDDLLTIAKEKISKSNLFKNSYIYIDEFAGFTKQEYTLIEELLKISKQITVSICTDSLGKTENYDKDIFSPNKNTIDKLTEIAKKNNIGVTGHIELVNSYRYKNEELEYLSNNLYNFTPIKYNKNCNNIQLFLANNNYSEIEYVANNIIELVRDKKYKYNEIAIITKSIEDYSSLVKSIFQKYKIPVFIDENKDLNQNILVKYIISLLDIFSQSWNQVSIFNYVKTGFITEISLEDIYSFENYCKKCEINGFKKFNEEWKITTDSKEDIVKLNNIRNIVINPIIKIKEKLDKNKTVNEITKNLYIFLEENNINGILREKAEELKQAGNIELSNIYLKSWDLVIDILDELVLILGEEKIGFDSYINLLKAGFNNSSLGKIPATLDEVIVGDVDRSRSSKKKVIFIIGLNDGKFPSVSKSEGFIDDNERTYLKEKGLELAKTTKEQIYDENFNIYKAFGIAEEKLFLSYSASDSNGKGLRKSLLINKIKKIFANLHEESDIISSKTYISSKDITLDNLLINLRKYLNGEQIEDIWFDIYNIYNNDDIYKEKLKNAINGFYYNNIAENINEENLKKLYGNTLVTSISKLESYKRCPFSYYLKYGLKLSDRIELKLEKLDTGTFMHDVIKEFFDYLKENNISVKEISNEEIVRFINIIVEQKLCLKENYIFNINPKNIILAKRLKKVISQAIIYIVDTLRYSSFKILGTEVEFGKGKEYEPIKIDLENNKGVEIIGKIDRIDIAENNNGKFIRIIDYKSSVKKVDLNEVVAGLQIQLLTYLNAVSEEECANIAGMLYFNLIEPIIKKKDKKLSEEQIEEEIRKNFKMDGLILGDVTIVKMMDNNLMSGDSNIIAAGLDKDGNLKEKSNILQKDEFKILQNKVEKTIKEISNNIMNGNIKQSPIYSLKNKTNSCTYCNYKSICGFDTKMCNNNYNYITYVDKSQILKGDD